MDEELAEEDRKNRKDRMGFDVVLEPPRHDQVIYLTESNLLYTYYIPMILLARSPRRSTGIRVASGFEFSVCLCVCSGQIF